MKRIVRICVLGLILGCVFTAMLWLVQMFFYTFGYTEIVEVQLIGKDAHEASAVRHQLAPLVTQAVQQFVLHTPATLLVCFFSLGMVVAAVLEYVSTRIARWFDKNCHVNTQDCEDRIQTQS